MENGSGTPLAVLFNSPLFLFLFLPVVGILYALAARGVRNWVLLIASAFFYAWGEPTFVLVVIASAWLDYVIGAKLAVSADPRRRKQWVALAVAGNLGLLIYFKYTNFLCENIGGLLAWAGLPPFPWLHIALPIGVSFIVFEKITYTVDLYRGKGAPATRFSRYLLYVMFFPKLMAGPIIKYHDISDQFDRRSIGWSDLSTGVMRFVVGFAKKTLIADTVGHFADQAFAAPASELDATTAWVGVLCFAVQIFFDFSGYSDMAIGLARCFGFRLLENFNQPYLSLSFTEFWRRWHISLSSWIKEYLYIPLGGSRGSTARTYFNLWFCFLLSGLWHGASWMFVIWGAYHGSMLVIERLWWLEAQRRLPVWSNRLITFVLVVIGWIPFRAGSVSQTGDYLAALFRFRPLTALEITGEIWTFLALGLAICFWPAFKGYRSVTVAWSQFRWRPELGLVASLLLFWTAVARMASSSFQSFIYFRF